MSIIGVVGFALYADGNISIREPSKELKAQSFNNTSDEKVWIS
jgi:hypothetical protein